MSAVARLLCFGIIFLCAAHVQRADAANGVVASPNCNDAGFSNVLSAVDSSGGGTVTFNCGTATITITSYKQIANAVTIDGGGTITLDGGNTSPFLQIFGTAHVVLTRLTFQHGVTDAVHALENFGSLTLDRVTMKNNTSTETPLVNYGTLRVQSSTFSGNATSSSMLGNGGAIENSNGDLTVNASTFSGNSAARLGGAIYSDGPFDVVNSTFTANSSSTGGGAIYQVGTANSTLTYATVVGNSAPFGAGLYADGNGNTFTIAKSIVSDNMGGNCDGVLATGGYNLSDGTGCGGVFTGTGDLINQTLTMGALANNGGPTLTMLPAPGNPAINHVPSAQCLIPVDQRGAVRPSGASCDSGAVEAGGSLTDLIFYDGFE